MLKRAEIAKIKKLLQDLGFAITRFRSREKPDAYVTAITDGQRLSLDIEHTDYYMDASPGTTGGSPGARLHEFWLAVQCSLCRRITRMKDPPRVSPMVFLKTGIRPQSSQASEMACELVAFAKEWADGNFAESISHFNECYPLLCRYVSKIRIGRVSVVICRWPCHDVTFGMVGIVPDRLAAAIAEKNRKFVNYEWRTGSRRWLLISTNVGPITSGAPGPGPEYIEWDYPALEKVCRESPFDEIFVSNCVHGWYKQLKP